MSWTGSSEKLPLLHPQTVEASVKDFSLTICPTESFETIYFIYSVYSTSQFDLLDSPMAPSSTALTCSSVTAFFKSEFASQITENQSLGQSWRHTTGLWTGAELLWFAPICSWHKCLRGAILNGRVCEKTVKETHTSQSEPTVVQFGITSSGQ